MKRRVLIKAAAALPFALAQAANAAAGASPLPPRARPGDPGWPSAAAWQDLERSVAALRAVAPGAGSYVSESDYFPRDWQRGFWGDNYGRLAAIKRKYDPDGLFFVHHGVGSEAWSADGFTRLAARPADARS